MTKHLIPHVILLAAVVMTQAAAKAAVIPVPDNVSGPTYGDPYTVDKLFDAAVTDADVDVTDYSALTNGQWAGPGDLEHEVLMDFGSEITANGVAYAQRAGTDPLADKVGEIEFWFSNTPFTSFPSEPADAKATTSITTDSILHTYSFGKTLSGQYVAAKFFPASLDPPTNNPGGLEMRLLNSPIPEPSTAALVAICWAIGLFARKREGNVSRSAAEA